MITPIPDHIRAKVRLLLPGIRQSKQKGMLCPAGGLAASLLKEMLVPGEEIIALLDNNETKHGTLIGGVPVIPLSGMEKTRPSFVMVATISFRDEIIAQLRPLADRFGFQILDLCDLPAAPDALLHHQLSRLDKMYTIQCREHIDRILSNPEYDNPLRLEKFGYSCYSQHDEDGIIQEIIRRTEGGPKTFVEFGAGDGMENNTLLLLKQGWSGLWIDAGAENAFSIRNRFEGSIQSGTLTFLEKMITRENINELIGSRYQGEIGFLSVDVDGNDYYIWESISVISPRIVAIEYNAKFPPPIKWSITYDPEHVWDGSDYMGASLAAIADLGCRKNYQLVGCNINGTNAFFVRKDLVKGRFIESADPATYYHPPRYYLMEGFRQSCGHRPDPRTGCFF